MPQNSSTAPARPSSGCARPRRPRRPPQCRSGRCCRRQRRPAPTGRPRGRPAPKQAGWGRPRARAPPPGCMQASSHLSAAWLDLPQQQYSLWASVSKYALQKSLGHAPAAGTCKLSINDSCHIRKIISCPLYRAVSTQLSPQGTTTWHCGHRQAVVRGAREPRVHLQSLTEQSQEAVSSCAACAGAATQETASSCAGQAPSRRPCCVAYACTAMDACVASSRSSFLAPMQDTRQPGDAASPCLGLGL